MDEKNKRQTILIGVLIVVVIYYFIDTLLLNPSNAGGSAPGRDPEIPLSSSEAGAPIVSEIAAVIPVEWEGTWESDPFFYVSADSAAVGGGVIDRLFGDNEILRTAKFDLTGISWLGNSGYAIINGSFVKEGETIGGYNVEKVAIDYVILKQGTNTIRLSLNE